MIDATPTPDPSGSASDALSPCAPGQDMPLAQVLEGLGDGVWDWDLRTDKVYYSPRFRALLGYETPGDFEANFTFRSHLHPDDRERVTARVRAHLDMHSGAFDMEYRLRTREGAYRWFHGRGQATSPDAQGKPTRLTGHLTDVNSRAEAEVARQQMETQWREAHKLETMGTLVGGVAQDFHHLLSAMLGRLQLARKGLDAQDAAVPHLDAVAQSAERAKALVQQVLAFSRQQTQHMQVQDLGRLVADALARLQGTVPEAVTLTSQCPDQPVRVLADAEQLRQAVTHLCTNAWQAMGEGAGQVTVVVAPCAHGGATLVVQDTGAGMSTDVLARVFEPFFSTKMHTHGGRGLGLAAVYGIVKTHQGSIGVQSVVGKGSRFEVWLPAVKVDAQAGQDVGPSPELAPAQRTPAGTLTAGAPLPGSPLPRHVVYIDDYEAMVYLISRMLKKHGIRVSAFERTADALALIRANPDAVDLLVTDYNMPGMSGLDVVRQVKKWAPALPMVITSGHVTPGMSAEAYSAGVLQVLNKHDSVEELAAHIAKIVQQLPVRPGAAAEVGGAGGAGAGTAVSGEFPG